MVDRAREINCYQCGLPLPASDHSSKRIEERGEELFCCSGCYLVNKITGIRGEEGLSQALLGKFGLGLLLSMNVMLLSAPFYGSYYGSIDIPENFAGAIKFVLLFLSLPVILILGYPILISSLNSIRNRIVGTEALILIGTVSAFLISVRSTITGTGEVYYETATMILTLFTLGRYIDSRAKWKASESIKGLSSLMPANVLVLEDGHNKRSVPAGEVSMGDRVLPRLGEMIPLDGIVISGSGSVDESFLTGESKPVLKEEGMEVFSGSINLDGNLILEIRKPADEFVVKKIERLMERIRENPSHIKRIGDAIASRFVPVIVLLSLGSLAYWITKAEPSTAVMRMLSILLISCPCAFGIAAPLAIWRGLGKAAERGAIIMGADMLEGLSKIKTVFFDKTGTITSHTPALTDIITNPTRTEKDLLSVAASLEIHSTHPLAASLVSEAENQGVPLLETDDLKTRPGFGIEGKVNGNRYYLGSGAWVRTMDIPEGSELLKQSEESSKNKTVVFLKENKELIGLFLFEQSIREGTPDTFEDLKKIGIRTAILTGDNKKGVTGINERLMPDDIKSELLPEDKVRVIEEEKKVGAVAMVGDGINDAPALEAAHIGIAMGCGTELTRESAKINLLGNDLRLIPYLIQLSKKVRKKVYANFFWSSLYNIAGIYLAVTGAITPLFAVVAMILSSLIVIGNSMRL